MEFSWYNRSTTRSRFSIYQTFITSIIARIIYQFFNTYYFRAWKCHLLVDVKVVALRTIRIWKPVTLQESWFAQSYHLQSFKSQIYSNYLFAMKRDLCHCPRYYLHFSVPVLRLPGLSIFHFSFYLMVNVNEWSHNQGLENKIILNSKYIYSIPFVL